MICWQTYRTSRGFNRLSPVAAFQLESKSEGSRSLSIRWNAAEPRELGVLPLGNRAPMLDAAATKMPSPLRDSL